MSVLQAFMQGRQARQQENQMMRQNMMQQYMQQNAQGIMSGDEQSIAGVAQFDPMMALNIGQTHQQNARANRQDSRAGEMHNARLAEIRENAKTRAAEAAARGEAEVEAGQIEMIENALVRADSAFRNGDKEGYSRILSEFNLNPEEYPFESFPEIAAQYGGAIDGIKSARELRGVGDNGTADNQTERDIALLGELGIPRDEAIEITQLHTTSRDPVTGEAVILNKRTGQEVQRMETPTPTPEPAGGGSTGLGVIPSEGTDFRGALGMEGAATAAINAVSDFAFGMRPFQEQGRARTALKNVRTRTLTTLASTTVPGRPSNYVMEMFNENVVQPSIGSGPEGALDTAEQTLAFLKGMEQENRNILQSRVSATARSEAQANLERLKGLREDYEVLVQGLSGAPVGVEQSDIDLMNELLGNN